MPAPIPSPEEVASARRIQVWKEFIPLPLRFPLILFIIIVYMFSGGVYMSAVSEMSGSLSWITEDIMMAGYASMTGLTMAFPLLFRILFRFQPRSLLLFSAGVFIVSDYLCMVCDFLPLVVLRSFVSGFFKIVGTFVCWSNVHSSRLPPNSTLPSSSPSSSPLCWGAYNWPTSSRGTASMPSTGGPCTASR